MTTHSLIPETDIIPFPDLSESCFAQPDPHTRVLYLEVPDTDVVRLQVYFELYEGLGSIRTIIQGRQFVQKSHEKNQVRSIIAVITTTSLCADCISALRALGGSSWQVVSPSANALGLGVETGLIAL